MSLNLPPELRRVLPAARWEDVSGESGARVWRSQKFVVKVQPLKRFESLRTEQAKLRWLAGRVPVPRVVGYAADEASEYLATTRLPGLPLHHPDALLHARRNAELLARALRELHALPIRDCPFNASLAVKLRQARERVEGGLVDEADFDTERRGQSAEQVLRALLKSRPAAEDLVRHARRRLPAQHPGVGRLHRRASWTWAARASPTAIRTWRWPAAACAATRTKTWRSIS